MEEKDERRPSRRRLLRSAGAVAAGVAGAGVAGTVAATPAAAGTGDQVLAGTPNTADETTGIELTPPVTPGVPDTRSTKAALRLTNTAGPALTADPVDPGIISDVPPVGSVYVDQFGDISVVAEFNGVKFVNTPYSPTWAVMPFPIPPTRWLDTRFPEGMVNVVPGSGTVSGGRIVPKGTNQADLLLDFSQVLAENYVTVQAIVSVHAAQADGWVTLWGDGDWPEAVSVNFLAGRVVGGLTQTELTGVFIDSAEQFGRMKIKTSHAVAVTVDLVGFITPNPATLVRVDAPKPAKFGIASGRAPKVAPRKR